MRWKLYVCLALAAGCRTDIDPSPSDLTCAGCDLVVVDAKKPCSAIGAACCLVADGTVRTCQEAVNGRALVCDPSSSMCTLCGRPSVPCCPLASGGYSCEAGACNERGLCP